MRSVANSPGYRWMVAQRILAAVVGGYMLTSVATVLLALIWPLSQAESVAVATMLSFFIYLLIIIWVFSTRSLRTIWLGLLSAVCASTLLCWWLAPPGGLLL